MPFDDYDTSPLQAWWAQQNAAMMPQGDPNQFAPVGVGAALAQPQAAPVQAPQAPMQAAMGAGAPSPAPAGGDQPSTLHQMLLDGWRQRGVPDQVAAGMIGAQLGESGRGLNPAAYNPNDNGSPSGGISQWHGDRWQNLLKFAQDQGTDWRDPKTQLNYYFHEVDTSPRFKNLVNSLKAGTTWQDGLNIGVRDYEVPADIQGQISKRANMAQQFASAVANGTVGSFAGGKGTATADAGPGAAPGAGPVMTGRSAASGLPGMGASGLSASDPSFGTDDGTGQMQGWGRGLMSAGAFLMGQPGAAAAFSAQGQRADAGKVVGTTTPDASGNTYAIMMDAQGRTKRVNLGANYFDPAQQNAALKASAIDLQQSKIDAMNAARDRAAQLREDQFAQKTKQLEDNDGASPKVYNDAHKELVTTQSNIARGEQTIDSLQRINQAVTSGQYNPNIFKLGLGKLQQMAGQSGPDAQMAKDLLRARTDSVVFFASQLKGGGNQNRDKLEAEGFLPEGGQYDAAQIASSTANMIKRIQSANTTQYQSVDDTLGKYKHMNTNSVNYDGTQRDEYKSRGQRYSKIASDSDAATQKFITARNNGTLTPAAPSAVQGFGGGTPPSPLDLARDAINRGADRAAVIGRLKSAGIDTSGL